MSAQKPIRSPHLLLVDSDCEARTRLTEYLEQRQFRVTAVADSRSMSRALETTHFDLIILDILLNDEDGFATCRKLRERSQIPLFIVSSRAEEVDRIIGLELGADAYLAKPVNPRELSLRIRGVLRRCAPMLRDPTDGNILSFSFDSWVLDTTTRTLIDPRGHELAVTGGEYRLLTALLCASNRVVSRAQLQEALRRGEITHVDRSIDVRVSRLRQILQEDARAPRIIKTVHGQGYVVAVPVQFQLRRVLLETQQTERTRGPITTSELTTCE